MIKKLLRLLFHSPSCRDCLYVKYYDVAGCEILDICRHPKFKRLTKIVPTQPPVHVLIKYPNAHIGASYAHREPTCHEMRSDKKLCGKKAVLFDASNHM